jgi:hypothetical protein
MFTKRNLFNLMILSLIVLLALAGCAQVSADAAQPRLVGTWQISVAESNTGLPPFFALQTFNADGTMTETSSLLGLGEEGPAHGVWSGQRNEYQASFELFVFDENGEYAGKVRVRCQIHLDSADHLTAQTAVDFIEPDGTIIPDIDGGPFEGVRMQVVPVK